MPPSLLHFADSAWLKILQFLVTAIALPLMAWGGAAVLDRLTSIEKAITTLNTNAATVELRMVQAETRNRIQDEQIDAMRQSLAEIRVRMQLAPPAGAR